MRVLILYAKVGNGHYKAAEAIKENIKEKYPQAEIFFEDGLQYSSVITNTIAIKGYTNMVKYIPSAWGYLYYGADTKDKTAINELSKLIHKGMTIKLKKLFRQIRPDVVLSTHPFVTKTCAYLKKKNKTDAKIVSLITDYAIHNMWIEDHIYLDKILVATEEMKYDCLQYGVPEKKLIVTGLPVSNNFKESYDRDETLKKYGLENKKTFLFFAGGGLGLGKSDNILRDLLEIEDDFQVVVVSGKNEKQRAKFEKIKENYSNNVVVLGYTNDVPELMNMCDFVITKPGGLTSTECLYMNKPMVIINPIPGQEEQNAIFLTNNGIAVRVYDDEPFSHPINILLRNKVRVEQMKEMCKHISFPNASDTIVRIMMDECSKSG